METDLFGNPLGSRSERIEYGHRALRDSPFGKKGSVDLVPNDYDPYDGAHFAGGPRVFEVVKRQVVTITGRWVAVGGETDGE